MKINVTRLFVEHVSPDQGLGFRYRWVGVAGTLHLELYPVVRLTPHGAYIDNYGQEKFVLNKAAKTFAHPTPEEAWEYLAARTKSYKYHLQRAIERVSDTEKRVKELKDEGFRGTITDVPHYMVVREDLEDYGI